MFRSQRPSIYNYFSNIKGQIQDEIKSRSDQYILSVNVDEYCSYLVDKFSLPTIVPDETRDRTLEKVRCSKEMNSRHDEPILYEFILARIGIPVIPNNKIRDLLEYLPSSYSTSSPKLIYENGHIITEVSASESEVQSSILEITSEIETRNKDVQAGRERIKQYVYNFIQNRKSQLEKEETLFESIVNTVKVPLKRKSDTSQVIPAVITYKEKIKLVMPQATTPTRYSLGSDKFLSILEIVDNICIFFERTPLTFAKLDEPDLRNVILSSLNGVFEGNAVGEAFSVRGKTDIYLKLEKGDVFIAECKHWDGASTLEESVSQILKYLTWRETYGVVILFVKRKNFTDILNVIETNISAISSFTKGKEKMGKSHFRAFHRLPGDDKKLVEIHYVAYNLHCE